MPARPNRPEVRHATYARTCMMLERAGRPLGISAAKELANAKRSTAGQRDRFSALAADLELGAVRCDPQSVVAAAKSLAALSALVATAVLKRPLKYREAHILAGSCVIPIVGGWLVNEAYNRDILWAPDEK